MKIKKNSRRGVDLDNGMKLYSKKRNGSWMKGMRIRKIKKKKSA